MTFNLRRLLFWAVPLAFLALGLVYAFLPQPIEADLATVARGPLVATVSEEGETRIKDIFVVSAPVRGRALRLDVEAGDAVAAGVTVVAEIEPNDPAFLDRRSEAEAKADVERAEAALAFARADLDRLRAEREFAAAELVRVRRLTATRTVSERTLEDAQRADKSGAAAVAAAEATVKVRQSELTAARARLLSPQESQPGAKGCDCLAIRAPVSGLVLRVQHESEGVVEAGAPLLEIGDPENLEIVVDFLSSDAVRIEPGQRVVVDQWGGPETLEGVVDRVEPFGFTKVSALGIEEQRVNVVIAFVDPPERWRRLRHGFQVEAQVVLWEADSAVKVPLTALFRNGGDWAVFVVENGRAHLRKVEIGHRTDLEAEITAGLADGDVIVRYPSNAIADGSAIRARRGD